MTILGRWLFIQVPLHYTGDHPREVAVHTGDHPREVAVHTGDHPREVANIGSTVSHEAKECPRYRGDLTKRVFNSPMSVRCWSC